MVREASRREAKFEAKVDPDVLRVQTTALKPLMVKGQRDYFPAITSLEERIKKLVEAEGVTTLQVRDYLNFGREMYELTKKFQATTLQAEAQLRVNKWTSRALSQNLLSKIAGFFGVSIPLIDIAKYDITTLGFGRAPLTPGASAYQALNMQYTSATESRVNAPMWKGKFTALKVGIDYYTIDGPSTVTLRKNTQDTLLALTIPWPASGVFTKEEDVEVEENDLCCIKTASGGAVGAGWILIATVYKKRV